MKKNILRIAIGSATSLLMVLSFTLKAGASTDYSHLIDDQVFDTTNSMTASQIDSFLNSFSGSCISENKGFAAPDPTGYTPSGGFSYGGNVSGGRVIYDAAVAYGLNPQVLLATLQKEQSLVTGAGGCGSLSYAAALGYDCPDSGTTHNYTAPGAGGILYSTGNHFDGNGNASGGTSVKSVNGTCVENSLDVGFSQQIIHATWLLKFDEERSEGKTSWAVVNSSWDDTDDLSTCYEGYMTTGTFARCPGGSTTYYDGDATIDSTAVTMDDGSTAALYDYTPHLSGNNNFVTIFDSWFGSTYTPAFAWQELGMTILDAGKNTSIPTNYMHSGDRVYVELTVENTGSSTWYNSGSNPVRLGTAYPLNGDSSFCDATWINCHRAATLSEPSVAPGATGHFDFYAAVPNVPGAHQQFFEPVAENQSWMSNGTGFNIYIQNTEQYDWQWLTYDAYTNSAETTPVDINNLARGEQVFIVLYVQNESANTWYNDGANPVHLGTADPLSANSILCTNTWLSCNRAATMDQPSLAPGQTGTFSFTITTPSKLGTYREYFKPVLENKTWTEDNYHQIYLNVTH